MTTFPLRDFKCGIAARVTRKSPLTFTAEGVSSQTASVKGVEVGMGDEVGGRGVIDQDVEPAKGRDRPVRPSP